MTTPLSTNAAVTVSNDSFTLTATPSNNAIHVIWTASDAVQLLTAVGGYLMVVSRTDQIYIVNLNAVEAAEGSYTITNLDGTTSIANGTQYMIQYVQINSDSSHTTSPTLAVVPHAGPQALTILDDDVQIASSDDLIMSVTIKVNNPNSNYENYPSKISFRLVQWHEDDTTGSTDDPNAVGGNYVGDDILNYVVDVSSYADETPYTFEGVPKGHYKCCGVYINAFGLSPVSNVVDVYAFTEPNNFTSLQVTSGGSTLPFTASLTDNPNARVEIIVATLLQGEVVVATKNIAVGTTNNTWSIDENNLITVAGSFTTDDGLALNTGYTVKLVANTAAVGDENDNHGKMNDAITDTGVAMGFDYTPSVAFYPDRGYNAQGYDITVEGTEARYYSVTGTDGDGNNVAGLAQTYISTNSNTINSQYVLDGTYVTATVYDIVPTELVSFFSYPSLVSKTTSPAASLYAHAPVDSLPLVIELPPEHASVSMSYREPTTKATGIKAIFTWDANTKPTNVNVFVTKTSSGNILNSVTNNSIIESIDWSKVVTFQTNIMTFFETSPFTYDAAFNNLEDGVEYTFWILQVNLNTPTVGVVADSFTYKVDYYPPDLLSVSAGQVDFTKSATFQASLSTEIGDWEDLSAVADITVANSSGVVISSYSNEPVESLYTLTGVPYTSVVTAVFKTKAKHSLFPNPVFEYSEGQTVSFTMEPYTPPSPDDLTWAQNGYANSGAISWTPLSSFPSGATVSYSYSINGGSSVTISSTDAANGSFNLSSVPYNVEQVLTLTVTVTYNAYTTTNSSSVTYTAYPYEVSAPDGLTWTQNGTEDNGTITWDAISDIPSGATVSYSYYIVNNEVNLGSVSVSSSDAANTSVDIPLVQYAVEQVLTLEVSVTYCGDTSTNSSSVTFTPEMPELSTSLAYTKGAYSLSGSTYQGNVSVQLSLSNGYFGTDAFVQVVYNNPTSFAVEWVGLPDGVATGNQFNFNMPIPSTQKLMVKVNAKLANGTFPNATKTSDWIYDAGVTWTVKPTITLDSASAISATSSSITYTIKNNGSNLTGTLVLAIPTSSTNASSIVTVDTGPFVWSEYGVQASRTLTSTLAYNIFPSGSTNKDDISVLIAASNGDGFSTFEQGLSPI